MNELIHLKNSNLPKMIGDLMHSNQFLKIFSLAALAMTTLSLVVISFAIHKEPIVLTLIPNGNIIEKSSSHPKAQDQVDTAIRHYLDLRYHWEPGNVQTQIKSAESFVLKGAQKAYESATTPIIKFSTDKLVSQRVYPDQIVINLEKNTASVTGDRLTDIQGMRAAGNLKLTLYFESGPRTEANPWGIYISKEKEEQ